MKRMNLWLTTTRLTAVSITSIALLFALFASYSGLLKKYKKINILNSGVTTCFNRVTQSFTSFMVKNAYSPYLKEGFLTTSSDCFSELNKTLNENFSNVGPVLVSSLNEISNDVHWLHEDINKNKENLFEENFDTTSKNFLARKYIKLENAIYSFSDSLAEVQSKTEKTISYISLVTIAAGMMTFSFLALLMVRELNLKKLKDKIESKAHQYTNEGKYSIQSARDILMEYTAAFEMRRFNEYFSLLLGQVERLSENKQEEITQEDDQTISKIELVPQDQTQTAQVINEENFEWKEDKRDQMINLGVFLADTIKSVSSQAFSKGVLIKLNGEFNHFVWGKAEALQQSFYSILMKLINEATQINGKRQIQIGASEIGNIIHVTFMLNNHCFKAQELDYTQGNSVNGSVVDTDLMLSKELIEEMNAKLLMKNRHAENSNSYDAVMEVVLNRAKDAEVEFAQMIQKDIKQNRTVQSIIKGTKKEILRELRV